MKITIKKEPELAVIAGRIAKKLVPGDIIALNGPLGAGKTTFTQYLLRAMNYTETVSSPTFVLENRYPVKWNGIKTVLHLDLYRLNEKDLPQLDWDDYLLPTDQLTLIEWPDVARAYLPAQTKFITIEIVNDKTRCFEIPDSLA